MVIVIIDLEEMYIKSTLSFLSQSGIYRRTVWLMYLVAKKVAVTVGKFKDYIDEIQQSSVLGFTPFGLQKNADGTFVTPIRVYDGKVYVLDDVATM